MGDKYVTGMKQIRDLFPYRKRSICEMMRPSFLSPLGEVQLTLNNHTEQKYDTTNTHRQD